MRRLTWLLALAACAPARAAERAPDLLANRAVGLRPEAAQPWPDGRRPTQPAAGASAVVERLTAQADAWDKAIVRKDRAAIEANMADDFRQIDRAGNVETKATFVEGLMSPDLQIDPYAVEDFEIRMYGDVALLSGRTRMTGRYQGKPFASHYRYIDVYVRSGDTWKVASVQISPIPSPSPSGGS